VMTSAWSARPEQLGSGRVVCDEGGPTAAGTGMGSPSSRSPFKAEPHRLAHQGQTLVVGVGFLPDARAHAFIAPGGAPKAHQLSGSLAARFPMACPGSSAPPRMKPPFFPRARHALLAACRDCHPPRSPSGRNADAFRLARALSDG
jgi:hypothetical protein